jgi:hypothetical protein
MTDTKIADLPLYSGGTAELPSSADIPVAISGTTYRTRPAQWPAGGTADLSDATPLALGTATAGTATTASRGDHRHAMPGAADVGAVPTGRTLTINGDTQDLSANRTFTVSGGGGVLAVTSYNPNSNETITVSQSSSFAALDATNLTITFTVPASGNVIVVLSAAAFVTGASREQLWALINASGDALVTGSARSVLYTQGDALQASCQARIYLTGLTPSASVTYRWAGRSENGDTTIYLGRGSNDQGAATMEVWSA